MKSIIHRFVNTYPARDHRIWTRSKTTGKSNYVLQPRMNLISLSSFADKSVVASGQRQKAGGFDSAHTHTQREREREKERERERYRERICRNIAQAMHDTQYTYVQRRMCIVLWSLDSNAIAIEMTLLLRPRSFKGQRIGFDWYRIFRYRPIPNNRLPEMPNAHNNLIFSVVSWLFHIFNPQTLFLIISCTSSMCLLKYYSLSIPQTFNTRSSTWED